MSEIDKLKRIKNTLKGIEREQAALKEEEKREFEAAKIALQAQSVSEMERIGDEIKESNERTLDAIQSIKIEAPDMPEIKVPEAKVTVEMPEIPEIKIPTINVPEATVKVEIPEIIVPTPEVTVNVPKQPAPVVNLPEVVFPDTMHVEGDMGLRDVTRDNPVPVMMVDLKGNPAQLGGSQSGGSKIGKSSLLNKEGVTIDPANDEIGFESTLNSTTVILDADEVFTGEAENVLNYTSISTSYKSDVAALASGFVMETSPDGENWDTSLVGDLGARTQQAHKLSVETKFFRVVYTNGPVAQTFFRLQTICNKFNSMPLINRAGQPQNTVDTLMVRQSADIDLDFARKHVPGGRSFFFFGFNGSVDSTWQDIHPMGGDNVWLEETVTLEVSSSNANDTAGGSGVRSIEVHGLSDTGVDQDEVIVMGGLATVESALTYRRVNKVHSETCGTYGGSHFGNVSVAVRGGNSTLSVMTGEEGVVGASVKYGSGEAGNGFWSVPLGKVMYLTRLEVIPDVSGNKTVDVALYERENILDITTPSPRRVIWQERDATSVIEKVFKSHIKIKALTDIWFRAVSTGTSPIAVSLDFYLVDADADGA